MLSNLYPSVAHPAFGTFVAARVDALRAAGAQVDVVAVHDPAAGRRVLSKYASLSLRSAAYAIRRRVRGQQVDIVEAHIAFPTGLVAGPVAASLGAPLVLFAHGADVLEVPWRSRRHEALARRTYAAARLVIANSEFLAGRLRAAFPRIAERITVMSPGIEFARFARRSDPPDQRAGLLYVGRLVAPKGCAVLFHAIAALEPSSRPRPLTVIGDGPERVALQALARDLGLEVQFRGEAGRDAVADAMRAAAVVAVPSTYQEPLGLVALEAMAAGAIVIASAVGGLAGIVENGVNGLAVPPDDVAALAAAIGRGLAIAGDPETGARFRAAALKTAEAHDLGPVVQASLSMYAELAT